MIVNKTVLTKEKHYTYNRFLFKRRALPIIVIIELVLLILAVAYFFTDEYYIFGLVDFLIVFLPFVLIVSNKISVKKMYESQKLVQDNPEIEFNFGDTQFEIKSSDPFHSSQSILAYEKLYQVLQDNENFYFFLNRTNAFIVDKKSFKEGNKEELQTILEHYPALLKKQSKPRT